MNLANADHAKYGRMRWNTPLSDEHAAVLLDRFDIQPGTSILDLGCGWGELLLRAVARDGSALGVGVDTDAAAIERGRALAVECGLDGRVRFVNGAAAQWQDPADRVLCVGAAHAWGGTESALTSLRPLIRPGGRLLFADGCWAQPPTEAAAAMFGSDVLGLVDVVAAATGVGWRVLDLSTADQREWDEFEATWRLGREEWLLANPTDDEAAAVRVELDALLTEYVGGYRGVLGFCYLILTR